MTENATIDNRVTVTGNVNLILSDGKTLTAKQGITVSKGNSLTIWAQTGGTGTLYAGTTRGGDRTCLIYCAGIGGGLKSAGGNINITGGTVTAYGDGGAGFGGGAYGEGGNITITGGTVEAKGNGGAGIGGGCYCAGGAVNLTGGNSLDDGGGVIVNGALTVTGGSITGNAGNCGGGVYVADGGALTLTGGAITGNTAVVDGGGVFAGEAAFDMTGGSIDNNRAVDDVGGGVFVGLGSAFTMKGGRISGNTALSGGGGLYIYRDNASATVSGGEISNNKSGFVGGGVYVDEDARFALSGAPGIAGNTRSDSAPDDVYLYRDSVITVAGALTCAEPIGVTTRVKPDPEEGFVTVTDGLKACGGDISLFKSENEGCVLGWNEAGTEAVPGRAIVCSAEGYEGVYDGAAHGIRVTVTAPEGGADVKYGTAEGTYDLIASPTYADAGSHTVYYRVSAKGYYDAFGSASVNIAAATLTVTADAKSKTEGEADPALTYTATGLIGDDSLTGALSRAAGELPGAYAIAQGSLKASANYALTYKGASLTVKAKPEIVIPGDFTFLPVATTVGPTSIVLGWTQLAGAEGYDVFFTRCGKKSVYRMIESVPADATNSCSITGLKTGTAYKSYVMAWRIENGIKTYIGKASPVVHAIAGGENARYCNAEGASVRKSGITVKLGRRRRIAARVKGARKGKKVLKHASRLRYYSSDRSIAVVDARGRVRGVGRGVCVVYAVANNGANAAVTVTVE